MKSPRLLQSLVISISLVILAPQPAAADELKFGWIGPLTGNSAVLGVDSLKAVSMVVDRVNAEGGVGGKKIQVIAEDDQYQTAHTLTAYRKLTSVDGVKFIIVITYGGLFAIAEQAERDNVVLVDPLDCDENIGKLNRHVLCVAKTTASLGTLAAERAVQRQELPAAITYFEGDPFPKVTAEHAKSRLTELGHPPILAEGYSPGTTDFRALLGRVRAQKAKSLFMYGYDEMGLLARQAKELGIQPQIYTFGTVTSPGFLSSAQGSADGAVVVMWRGEGGARLDAFLKDFAKAEGRPPFLHISTVPSFDVTEILVRALRSGAVIKEGKMDAEAILSAFYGLKDYPGISGNLTMDADGVTRSLHHSLSVLKDGQVVPMS